MLKLKLMIEIKNLSKNFSSNENNILLYDNLNLFIPKGEFLTILGPNGCGKSTLFNLITGIDNDYSGDINIKSSKNSKINESIAYMLQKDLLLPWLTVKENILIGVKIQNKISDSIDQQINEYLELLKITHLINLYPTRLSGGERQKVALVRTLLLNTDILLLDEPFSAIDYNTRLELQSTIFKYAERKDTTVILVSHDIDEAIAVSDRIIIFGKKPAGIIFDIPIKLNIPDRSPVTARQHKQFSDYYKHIWENYPR